VKKKRPEERTNVLKKIKETFIYEALGFPVLLINVPMKKVFGEWCLDINFAQLQRKALLLLAKQMDPLCGREIRFIRHYLNMSTHKFGEVLGVTHVAVLHWESDEKKMNPSTEIFLRSYVLNHLKITDKEFRKIYNTFNPKNISKPREQIAPLEIDIEQIAC
jgi:DNA-binding transcriptional regulator YiaG